MNTSTENFGSGNGVMAAVQSACIMGSRPTGALPGIFSKFGKALPMVDRVRGRLRITGFTDTIINGLLLTDDDKVSVRFDAMSRGPVPVLRRLIESVDTNDITALSIVELPIWISARPWVEDGGIIVLLIRKFGIQAPTVTDVDTAETINHF